MHSAANRLADKKKPATHLRFLLRAIVRYSLAPLSVAISLGIGLLAWRYGIRHQFSMFLFAIVITAWYGGVGLAMVAVVFSTVLYDYCYNEPLYTLTAPYEDIPDFLLILLFGSLVGWFGAVRRGTENALRTSEEKYRKLIDAAPDAIFVWDAHGKCVLANDSAARLRGCRDGDAVKELGVFWAVINEPPPGSVKKR